jgi:hypothetical protein
MSSTISKSDFDAYFMLVDKLEAAFIRYADEVGIKYADSFSFDNIDEGNHDIEFKWHETWRYGGEETHTHYMPAAFLFDWPEWKIKHEADKAAKAEERARLRARAEEKIEKQERALLKKLKKQYEE